MIDEAVAFRYFSVKTLADDIYKQLRREAIKLGFPPAEITLTSPDEAEYRLEKDPSSCEYSLVGDWHNEQGMKVGCLLFHADGTFFVEHDIVKPHPEKKRWFVEAVNAWGKGREIKAEARLLPSPE